MTTIRALCTASAPEDIARHPHLPTSHHKAIDAICRCRTGAYGSSLSACHTCGQHHRVHHACGHRHCPQCQHHTAQLWLHNQLTKPLPGPSCLITFTVPEALRPTLHTGFGRAPDGGTWRQNTRMEPLKAANRAFPDAGPHAPRLTRHAPP